MRLRQGRRWRRAARCRGSRPAPFGALRDPLRYLPDGPLSPGVCAGATELGDSADAVRAATAGLLPGRRAAQSLSHGEGVSAHDCLWPRALALSYTEDARTAAVTQAYGALRRAASQQEPSYRVHGVLTDGFNSTTKRLRTLFPGVHLGCCLRHALLTLPKQRAAITPRSIRRGAPSATPCSPGRASASICGCLPWASGDATVSSTSPPRLDLPMASGYGAGYRTRRPAGMRCLQTRRCP